MLQEVIIFLIACLCLVKSAQYAVTAVSHLARFFRLTEFVTSFILVAVISSLPETFIGIIAALKGDAGMSFGTIFGGTIADLTLVLGLIALAGNPIKIESSIIKKDLYFIILTILPIFLGLNGVISRIDGVILLLAGIIFIITLLKERQYFHKEYFDGNHALKQGTLLLISLAVLLVSSHFIVETANIFAVGLGVPTLIIGLVVVALGTTLPELTFSLQSIRKGNASLAIGDILGSVVVDACILLGIIALIQPITISLFSLSLVGVFLAFAIIFSLLFMRTDGILSKNEAMALIFFYIAFVVVQVIVR
ncbi:hypothetical protein COV18_02850 [Candidatus Woesearchaeota archaeon CG10_big_fil_rev_8_21_14_0_10_37_12]|nr:MAG: hypothetical protein COV18_02850 [Candidatus Woesearchaeota archaeon CG10_big_fil_rev_8_21_14_0_10_37_12]